MQSKAATVEQYLAELPPDRRAAISEVRRTILANLGKGFEEGMQYGMIGYYVPHALYPDGYHCDPRQPLPFACLASQKNHMAVYLMCMYDAGGGCDAFVADWKKTGKKLDMGKSCIRFRKVEDLALDLIGDVIRKMPVDRWIEYYETTIKNPAGRLSRSKSAGRTANKAVRAKSDGTGKPKANRPDKKRTVSKRAAD